MVGLEPTKPEGERFTVSCNCRYATPQCNLQEQKDLNPVIAFGALPQQRPEVLETDDLSSELYSYISGPSWIRTTFSGFSVLRIHHVCQVSICGSRKIRLDAALSAISSLLEYCRGARSWPEATFEARIGLGSLAESWFLSPLCSESASRLRPLTHASLSLTLQNY